MREARRPAAASGMDTLNESFLWASLLWGSLGGGFLIYGWRQKSPAPLLGGVLLTLLSIFAPGWISMSVLSVGVLALVWWGSRNFG